MWAKLLAVALVVPLSAQGADAEDSVRPRLVVQLRDDGIVCDVAFSPDGRHVVTGGLGGTAWLWDAQSGREIRRFVGHSSAVYSVAFLPDGKSIVTGSDDASVRLWDVESGKETRRFNHFSNVQSVALSADGRSILIGSWDPTARLRDAESGKVIRSFQGHSDAASVVAFSPDGRHVLTGSHDGTARLWDADSGAEIRQFEGRRDNMPGEPCESVAFSPDGRHILTGGWDHIARIWDADSGKEVQRFEGHANRIESVAFSPDGRHVLTGGWDHIARIWEADSGKEVRRWEHPEAVSSVAFSPDGRRVLTGGHDGIARLFDAETGKEIARFEGHAAGVESVAFSASGRRLITGRSDGTARIWDADSGREIRRFEGHATQVESIAFSRDERVVLTGSLDKTARLWDAESGAEIRRFEGHSDPISSVALSPDGRRVLTGSSDGTARLWDAHSGQETRKIEALFEVSSVAFSSDGRRFLTGSWARTAQLWDADSGTEIRRFQGHSGSVWSVAFSPDDRMVLTGGSDGTARLWDTETGTEIRRFEGGGDNVRRDLGERWDCTSVAFSPDGRLVLTGGGDGTLQVWDTASGTEIRRFEGHSNRISSAAFSPDGRRILTGTWDGGRLWDTDSGNELCSLVGFHDGRWAVVTPDGRFDASDLERIDGLHWVMPDDPMTPVPVEVFMRDYYEPRLMARLLAGTTLPPVPPLVGLNRVQPLVRVAAVEPDGDGEVRVTIEVESRERAYGGKTRTSGAQDLHVFRDGQLVAHADSPIALGEDGKAAVVFRGIRLPRDGRNEVVFSAYAFNTDRVKSETHRVTHALPPLGRRKGTAFVVAFGVDAFADRKWNLSFAAADARAVAETLGDRLPAYGRVVPVLLTSTAKEDRARKRDLETVLWLLAGKVVAGDARTRVPEPVERARPEDLVVISLSTHGHTDEKGRFHIVPSDVTKGEGWLKSCISADELAEWLRDVDAGDIAMIVDACHSAAGVDAGGFKPGPMGSRGFGQLAYNKRMRVLAASQASDVALESQMIRHGLLTYALTLDGLAKGRADCDPEDGQVTLAEWLRYGEKRVPALAEEVAQGKVRAVGERGLDLDRKRRIAQQPSLFDFGREADDVVLATK